MLIRILDTFTGYPDDDQTPVLYSAGAVVDVDDEFGALVVAKALAEVSAEAPAAAPTATAKG